MGLLTAGDILVHACVFDRGLALLSKDDDFRVMVERLGPPPKLVFIRLGNVTTDAIALALCARKPEIDTFLRDPQRAVLTLAPD